MIRTSGDLDAPQQLENFLGPGVSIAPARQQPAWDDVGVLEVVRKELHEREPLIVAEEVGRLRAHLAEVAAGEAAVLQCGDCAESPEESGAYDVSRKTAVLDILAGVLKLSGGLPVVRAGRIAGQYAKPRSADVECVDGVELPVFRGHIVNRPEADPESRRADAWRMLDGYDAAQEVMSHLPRPADDDRIVDAPVWTSHEALLLDYEIPLLRRTPAGELLLTSTHWPWIGERTRGLEEAHVQLLARVVNPVACKVGPSMGREELLELAARLDPQRTPGRLTLIARMGARVVEERLAGLVEAVAAAGHPVIWLCDPLHANTVSTPAGTKTRFLVDVIAEVRAFRAAVEAGGGRPGGLHLETTPDDVIECVRDAADLGCTTGVYRSHCDPRLTVEQATEVASAWA